ncbi:uncharacterized protein LOC100902341 [Galendromus occidentalis]|uniref:Uncharacterized protein LOC100902341 n=1 Tax=Galendromus occidentalis TaxID=34638 RepID=A0AAJ7L2J3_9ACAR|nr:uncharacterized protein LOC100902341 [Galendromus occidentalis]
MAEPLTGGKGSSLAVLTDISKTKKSFIVPRGVCVTTRAYRAFVGSQECRRKIEHLVRFCGTQPSNEDLQRVCDETRKAVAAGTLPNEVLAEIRAELGKTFGEHLPTTKFAVRSSACGEDSENMSAAGQMETFLGIVGLEAIASAVAKCWASQFGFVAVQYKRRYGQPIDADMCVVIQQMVPSDVSGVMFTVDPITANPLLLSITANFGLGESVVSASADPDTFTVRRESSGSLAIESIQLGQKNLSTVMKGSGGTEDVIGQDRSREQSLTEDQVLQLAKIGILLEEEYASPRDAEWAFYQGELYMLQARPVTSVDNIDPKFEAFHEADCGLVGEFDSVTKANVGEVFGGSISTLTQTLFLTLFIQERIKAKKNGIDYGEHAFSRQSLFMFHHSQAFFQTFSDMGDLSAADVSSKGFSIAMCGRSMDDEIVVRSSANKKKYLCTDRPTPGLALLIPVFWRTSKSVDLMEKKIARYTPKALNKTDLREIYIAALSDPHLSSEAGDTHVQAICYGSLSNVALMSLLAKAEGDWTLNVFADFAALVSSCNNIISAGVPQSLQRIALHLHREYGSKFNEMDPSDALKVLEEGDTESARLFRDFLVEHGHRCLHEFDLVTKTWGMEPLPLVKTLQSMVATNSGRAEHGEDLTVDEIVARMTIKLPWLKRQALKFILHRVRNGIAYRERAKSCLVKSNHQFRISFRHLAKRMVEEGRLPEEDLLFFLSPPEILDLIDTRNPKLIVRAMHRMENAKVAAKDVYPEIVACPPFVPTNSPRIVTTPPTGARSMKGTPVSKGLVIAPARVITRLEDAHLIQKGDVLITYATDIGWSPYFPLISGIVTELGGLISHGAVVAREFGIPCIVGCHGATKLFLSGEEVILNGNQGLIATTSSD